MAAARKKTSATQKRKQQKVGQKSKQQTAKKKSQSKVAASQVSDLKAQVMKEVSKQNQSDSKKKETPVATPTAKEDSKPAKKAEKEQQVEKKEVKAPIAPAPQKAELNNEAQESKWADRLLVAMLVLGVVVIVWLLILGKQDQNTPYAALAQLETVIENGNVTQLTEQVNLDRVSASLVEQFRADADLNVAELPAGLKEALPEGAEPAAMLKPGLAELLKRDAMAVVRGDVEPQDLPDGLFVEIWQQLTGGQPLELAGKSRIVADDKVAEVDVLLKRADLAAEIPLTVRLERGEEGWQVVDLPDLQKTLVSVRVAEAEAVAPAAGKSDSALAQQDLDNLSPLSAAEADALALLDALQIESIEKGVGVNAAQQESLLLTLKLRNIGPEDVKAFQANVLFMDAAGQPMKSFTLSDVIGVQRGMRLEKTWRVPVNLSQKMEKFVYTLPQEALTVKVVPTLVELSGGRILKEDS